MPYRIAGIDVHKKMLAVVVSDVEIESEYQFERRMFGSNPEQLRSLAAWLLEQEAEEVVMESTAQYWKPVWETLERYWKPIREKREGARRKSGTLHLAQAESNRGRRGRKRDFPDAERLVKRLVSRELTLSFVPDAEQRLWRTVTRRKYQLTRDHVRLQNQLESLLEEAHIKLSSLVSMANCYFAKPHGMQHCYISFFMLLIPNGLLVLARHNVAIQCHRKVRCGVRRSQMNF
jgi:transposase